MSFIVMHQPLLFYLRSFMSVIRYNYETKDENHEKYAVVESIKLESLTSDQLNMISPRGYKTFFILNSVEHEILNPHKDKNI